MARWKKKMFDALQVNIKLHNYHNPRLKRKAPDESDGGRSKGLMRGPPGEARPRGGAAAAYMPEDDGESFEDDIEPEPQTQLEIFEAESRKVRLKTFELPFQLLGQMHRPLLPSLQADQIIPDEMHCLERCVVCLSPLLP
eukprot:m.179702 g.179702  ORF g.179702 m.179702 type:complete len:140 (+) comp15369_c0_seq19:163-582(+)